MGSAARFEEAMTKREAKRWACGMAAALLDADLEAGYAVNSDEPYRELKQSAMKEIVFELRRRCEQTSVKRSPPAYHKQKCST